MNQQVRTLRNFRASPKHFKIVDHGGTTVTVIGRGSRHRYGVFSQATWAIVKAMEQVERAERKKTKVEEPVQ